ncbi:hypothetical protein [Antarcticirhabdus aurantiaca]|uniref:Uncharacterized protein n=1 Tax=Antarcticirhabdus aurantiaca TaxID=2606717 RepID=A0ACD4NL03_9HYPH|nr:hypothetical protein [Antarcticirhabdus aurantiaca]WAJ27540.1 hypothetical protein OXU80_22265 [Jeongeuplla avenae]
MTLSNPVTIKLGGDEYDLKPSLKAAQNVSNRFNGFQNAIAAVAGNDLSAVTYIVRQGVPLKQISTDDLNEAVYEAGTRNIIGDVMKYVVRLSNGGRDPDLEDGDGAEERDEGNGVEL